MRKFKILLIAACLGTALFSCQSDSSDESFSISGEIKQHGDLTSVTLMGLDSTQLTVIDTATLDAQGKFKFNASSAYPNIYKIRVGESMYDVIAANGDDIEFSTTYGKDSKNFEIKGSREIETLAEFNKLSGYYGEKNNKLAAEYDSKVQKGEQSDSLLKVYRPAFQKNVQEYNEKAVEFMNKNNDKLTGFYAASSIDPRENEAQLIAYAEDIKDKFPDNPAIQRFVKQMMAAKPVAVGQKAQDFTLPGINGKSISLSDYKGKYVMLDFWASWCAPCRAENPNLVKQYKKHKSKGLNILGISLDNDKERWQQAIAADDLTWQHASSLQGFEGPVEQMYQINAIPSNFIIDPQGVIIAKNITGERLEEFLNKTFSKPE